MNVDSFEKSLIENAYATLAGLKVASLFNHSFLSREDCDKKLQYYNALLNSKGIYIELLKQKDNFYLIYVYRLSALEGVLGDYNIKIFLGSYGYAECDNIRLTLDFLKGRLLCTSCFPHEIGIFLGYPIGDVIGFINNNGKNCKYCGLWKVYCNELDSIAFFSKLQKCQAVYIRVYNEGRGIYDMTVRN